MATRKRKSSASTAKSTTAKTRSRRKKTTAKGAKAKPEPEPRAGEGDDAGVAKVGADLASKSWMERRRIIDATSEELQGSPTAQRVRALAELLAACAADPKWEVRLSVARAIAHLEHPDYASIAARLDTDDNSFVAKAARASAAKRREADLAFQAKSDEIDEVSVELGKLREAHGERVAAAAERIAEHKFRLLTNETTHEMRTVVASLLDALAKLDVSLAQSQPSNKLYERPLRIARERANFLQRMLDDTKKLVDQPKLEREHVRIIEMLDKVAEIVRDALDIPAEVRFGVETHIPATATLHVPRLRLIQALSSLAKNAIEATEGSGAVVLGANLARRGWVRISVSDDGYGMDPEEVRQALLPMVSSKKDDKHTGVGLPLAKKIIERECRGLFEIKSVPEQGTTIECLFEVD